MDITQNDAATMVWWRDTIASLGGVMHRTGVYSLRVWRKEDETYSYELVPVDAVPAGDTESMIRQECEELANMLVVKNQAYGDSALDPVRIFSQADPAEQIRVRIDDKLSRLARGSAAGEDVILDLMGYLVLLKIAMRKGEA